MKGLVKKMFIILTIVISGFTCSKAFSMDEITIVESNGSSEELIIKDEDRNNLFINRQFRRVQSNSEPVMNRELSKKTERCKSSDDFSVTKKENNEKKTGQNYTIDHRFTPINFADTYSEELNSSNANSKNSDITNSLKKVISIEAYRKKFQLFKDKATLKLFMFKRDEVKSPRPHKKLYPFRRFPGASDHS